MGDLNGTYRLPTVGDAQFNSTVHPRHYVVNCSTGKVHCIYCQKAFVYHKIEQSKWSHTKQCATLIGKWNNRRSTMPWRSLWVRMGCTSGKMITTMSTGLARLALWLHTIIPGDRRAFGYIFTRMASNRVACFHKKIKLRRCWSRQRSEKRRIALGSCHTFF